MAIIPGSPIKRAAIMAACAVGAVLTALSTTSIVLSRSAPDLAVHLWPFNAAAFATRASRTVEAANGTRIPPEARRDAMLALRYDPGNVVAARTMAVSDLTANNSRGKTWLSYGERYSRRDLPTQMAQIEVAVADGDIAGALRHYDRALRTEPGVYEQLFPVLETAVGTPEIRMGVIRLLRRRPDWRRAFVQQLIVGKVEPAALYDIAAGLRLNPDLPMEREQLGAIIQKLVRAGDAGAAMRLLPNASTQLVRNGDFELSNPFPPFDWQLQDDTDLSAVQETAPTGRNGNVLYLVAENGRSGEIATQYLTLPAGRYTVSLLVGDTSAIELDRPRLTVRCDIGSRQLLDAALVQAPVQGRRFTTSFAVPLGCAAQWLSLRLSSPSINNDRRPWIDAVSIAASDRKGVSPPPATGRPPSR